MRTESVARAEKANQPRAKNCTPKCNTLHPILPFEQFLRAVWPVDTAKKASRITGKSLRMVKYQLAGSDPKYRDIVAIIRSEYGYAFLQHVMGNADPAWWRGVQKAKSIGAIRRDVAEQNKRLAQLELLTE